MYYYDFYNSKKYNQYQIKSFIPLDRKLKKILNNCQITLNQFFNDSKSIIIKKNKYFILCTVKDIAGKRLIILGSNVNEKKLLSKDIQEILIIIGRKFKCDLIQWLLSIKQTKKLTLAPKNFTTNFIFRLNLNKNTNTTFIENKHEFIDCDLV